MVAPLSTSRRSLLGATALALAAPRLALSATPALAQSATPAEAEMIAKAAWIYGFPMVENYKTMFAYAIWKNNPEYKAPFNTIANIARLYTPEDKAIVTPNSDTPYSFVVADLRAEPIVLTVPAMDPKRYYSIQFIDLYTFNFAYVGTATTGNDAGRFLLAGPGWSGDTPTGIKKMIRSDTEFALLAYRTQLFGPQDLDEVKKVQAGYKVRTLSQFLGQPAPAPAPVPAWPVYDPTKANNINFIGYLNFLLQFCPVHPSEIALRERFTKIGIVPGEPFDPAKLDPAVRAAIERGVHDGQEAVDAAVAALTNAADVFGTRDFLRNDYLRRAAGAKKGIYGNSREEAYYFVYDTDVANAPLDATRNSYTLRFAPDDLPPVRAFWSVTMYDGKTQLLVANPLKRYLINSPMLPDLKRDPDGGLTLYIQNQSPGTIKASNWLPAPDGTFFLVMRLYWPEPEIIDGLWTPPAVQRQS